MERTMVNNLTCIIWFFRCDVVHCAATLHISFSMVMQYVLHGTIKKWIRRVGMDHSREYDEQMIYMSRMYM